MNFFLEPEQKIDYLGQGYASLKIGNTNYRLVPKQQFLPMQTLILLPTQNVYRVGQQSTIWADNLVQPTDPNFKINISASINGVNQNVLPDPSRKERSMIQFTPTATGTLNISASLMLIDEQKIDELTADRHVVLAKISADQAELLDPSLNSAQKEALNNELAELESEASGLTRQIAAVPAPIGPMIDKTFQVQ